MISDLISLIEKEKDVTNVIILTHNIDFVFFQLVVLPALKRCGQPAITIFADAHCAAETFAYQSKVLSGLGIRFRVVPILLESGFCFHPKAVLLSASNKATLFIGSGNLTFGGWRENVEVWIRFDSGTDGTAAFAAFNDYLRKILERVPLNNSVKAEIEEAFDGNTRSWATRLEEPGMLIGRITEGEALLGQMLRFQGSGPIERFICCSPYFDTEGAALQEFINRVQPGESEVLVQKGGSGFTKNIASKLPLTRVVPIDFTRSSETNTDRQPFLHAKFYAFQRGDEVTVFAGSANCSRAALTIPGNSGNAELLAIQRFNRSDFKDQYLNHFEILDEPIQLPDDLLEQDETPSEQAGIQILGARLEGQELRVAFKCAHNAQLTGCQVDESPTEFQLISDRIATVKTPRNPPRTVFFEGSSKGLPIRSILMWIDIEKELRSTSWGRAVSESIHRNVRPGVWNLGAWTEVIEVFCRHLRYIPSRAPAFSSGGVGNQAVNVLEFTEEDVFADSYSFPVIRSVKTFGSGEDRLGSLRQMFLQWFGAPGYEGGEKEFDLPDTITDDDGNETDGETVDTKIKILPGAKTPKQKPHPPKSETEKERKKARQIIEQVIQVMAG